MDGVRRSHAGPGEALEAAEVVAGGGTQHHRRLEVLPLLPRWPPALLQQYPFGALVHPRMSSPGPLWVSPSLPFPARMGLTPTETAISPCRNGLLAFREGSFCITPQAIKRIPAVSWRRGKAALRFLGTSVFLVRGSE